MYLYLVRHGEAKPKEQDPERPLSDGGVETARRVARFLRGSRLAVDCIHHSSKLRARQTAEILAESVRAPLTQVANLEPLAEVEELAESLRQAATDLMLVGHLPHLNRLASHLVAGDAERDVFSFPECGVLCLCRHPSEGGEGGGGGAVWTADWMLDPESLRRAQADLVASTRGASQGRLAAALSHELNNPLGVLASSSQMMERLLNALAKKRDDPDAVARLLGEAREAAEMSRGAMGRISRLVERFERLILLDVDDTVRRPVNVNRLLDDAVSVLREDWGDRIRVVREYADLPRVTAYPAGLSEVFEDVLDNAATAIEGEGEVRLTTRLERGYVWVRIADTGRGMASEQLGAIFEPGFRVKEGRVSTSWGLYIWRQIVHDHGGEFLVHSQPNQGTEVEICLPAGGAESG